MLGRGRYSLNGDKVIPLASQFTGRMRLELAYRMGAGLGSLTIDQA